jgi:hypothetical protein
MNNMNNMGKSSAFHLIGLTLVGLFVLLGCTSENRQNDELSSVTRALSQATLALSPAFEATNTITLTPALEPSATPTATKTATPMATDTPEATSTPPPLSTLPPEGADALLLDLLQNNAGCQLPCWWGAVPGETMWSSFESFLATFASEIVRTGPSAKSFYFYYVTMSTRETGRTVGHWASYAVHNDIIEDIETHGGRSPTYSLPQILTTYGPPEEIWLMTFQDTPTGSLPFRMSLLYTEKGFMVSYRVQSIEKQFDPYRLVWCPHDNEPQRVSLWLVSPEREVEFTFEEARETALHISAEEPYLQLSAATGLDEVSFYEIFKEANSSSCLETPGDLWPNGG